MAETNAIDLRKALDTSEIVPYFQPVMELRTGRLTGFEVLARWLHPVRGSISPNTFIPLAEENGLIGSLTQNLLERAFAAATAIPGHLSLSFNISPIQFHNPSLPEQIHSAAQQGGFLLKRLILEITESALIDDIDQAHAISKELKGLGISLALDDFGTGFSSLRHLQSLPFNELKIDASFVREMSNTRESRKIVAAILGLGHSLGLITVAEGIETKVQAEMLLQLGCDLGQGWLYGPPVPACDLPGFLSSKPLPLASNLSTNSSGNEMPLNLEALPAQRLSQLQAIYDGAPVGLCFIDCDLRYISINKRFAEINGVPVADHLGRYAPDVIPELFPRFELYIRRALGGEAINDLEIHIKGPDESHGHTFLVSYQPARDEADEVIGVSIAAIDITSRKLAEEALRESEDHYRHSVELSPQVPWTSDAQGMVLTAGPRWQTVTGLSPDQVRNEGWIQALYPDDVAPTLQRWKASLLSGCPVDVEFRVGRGNGVWRWMRSRGAPRRDSTGKIIRWYGTVEDIDDRKKAEQGLRESEALLRAVFDAVPVGLIISTSPSGSIIMSNPRAEAIFQRAVPLGENIDIYRHPNAYHADGRCLTHDEYPTIRAISEGKSTDPEDILYPRGDGIHRWVRATAAPVREKNGSIAGVVLAIQDIDEAIQEKKRLLDRISELESQSKAR